MTARVPPSGQRFLFRAVGKRVDPEYRAWVAQELADPLFLRSRIPASLVLPFALVVVPQTLLALAEHSRLRLVLPAVVLGVVAVSVVVNRNRTLSEVSCRRLLAYHGVTADGMLVEPISFRAANPLGTIGIVLFFVQVLVFSSGIAVAADRIAAERACHVPPAADLAALSAAIGRPVPAMAAGFGAPAPVVPPGTRLVAAREVHTGFRGLRYVAAYVPGPSGRLLGPAVWRVADPHSVLNPEATIDVGAQDFPARQITPDIGYGGSQRGDRQLDQARDCARAAR